MSACAWYDSSFTDGTFMQTNLVLERNSGVDGILRKIEEFIGERYGEKRTEKKNG